MRDLIVLVLYFLSPGSIRSTKIPPWLLSFIIHIELSLPFAANFSVL
jgi:hypothetical protein